MAFSRSKWATQKADIARRLAGGECDAGYGEAALVLCGAISAMAAEAWPGERIDRRRFVEFAVRFSRISLRPETISVPLLVSNLRDSLGFEAEEHAIRRAFLNFEDSRILRAADVDQPERAIQQLCPTLSTQLLRASSYADVLYRRIRSSYAHEYRPSSKTMSWPMTADDLAGVSYGNWINDPDRHIHFHIPWLVDLVIDLGDRSEREAMGFPLNRPQGWWVDG
jgi:hypothetical protein